ncbi:DUF1080 domain-containing protein [Plantactinospora sp. S1510]|uniref:DUF1080 domain-containing protein n=1 Tax=Plantactinospora alkalitolerans TaxID=2789879 RepID=A0ABS0H446_9ACTN|nr:DUF1080 domain-containing protein [Plantactinospora alkalitolerans]MBF9133232.1 DUF1080 domain-containing protein [Plantactinospora alkalitolerans]
MPAPPVRCDPPRRSRLLTRLATARPSRPMRMLAATVVLLAGSALAAVPAGARPADTGPTATGDPAPAGQLQAQVLTWTAGDSTQSYASAPTTAVAGATTLVFENSVATGNTTGMQHTLTFDTGNPEYNDDVEVNILADPFDSNQGRWTVDVVLTAGTYRYFCAIPGHGTMTGLLVVGDGGQDATPPTVTAAVTGEKDEDGAYVGAATVTLSATDTGSGVGRIEYSLDGGPYGTYTAPVTVNAAGQHTVTYRATDVAGNTSPVQSTAFQVVPPANPDTTAPTVTAAITGEQNDDDAYIGTATVTLTATDTESGVERIEYSLDGGSYAAYTAPVAVNQPGQHTVSYRASDRAGNTSAPRAVTFEVADTSNPDTTPPTVTGGVTGDRDDDGGYLGAATVTVSATDTESGVERIEYSLDGGSYAAYTAPVTVNQPGQHTVSYRATDVAGNTSTPGSVTFAVVTPPDPDTTAPSVTAAITGQQNGSWAYVGSATIVLTATDSGSGVHRVEYALDGRGYTAYSGPLTVNTAGVHTLSYRATDRAGNVSGTASTTFTVVASAPPAPSCQVTDTRPTVWIGTLNSSVPNRVVEGRCSINDLIEDERAWPDHDEFVAHVTAVAERLHHRGQLLLREQNALIRTARDSGVGRSEAKQGYLPLLDRSAASFKLWEQVGAGGFRRNADGSITSRPVDGLGMLWFPVRSYGDFSLKLQWRDDAPGDGRANSGAFVRFPQVHQHPQESRPEWVAIKYGHELQIYDRTDGDEYKSGSVYGFDRVDLDGAQVTPKGTWNDYEIRVVGQHYSIFRNGKLINEYVNVPEAVFTPPRADDPGGAGRQHASGYVGLQNHGAGDIVSFRNVRIAPLTP